MTDSKRLVERQWTSELLNSEERFQLRAHGDGYYLSGAVQIEYQGSPVDLTYRVEARPDWTTRSAEIHIPMAGVAFNVNVDRARRWVVNGRDHEDLNGCTDIDLGWTPATNTLPIRRMAPGAHRVFTIEAAWLQWPDLIFKSVPQRYVRRDNHIWGYQQGDFTADLETDDQGVVITYGSNPPIWHSG